jgi:ACR3 family arsenite efflux pump ArsB
LDRLTLERNQVWLYLGGIFAGLALGSAVPESGDILEPLLWPMLVALLYATFVQMPLLHVREAFSDHRFVTAVLLGNFVAVPLLVWALLQWLPPEPSLRLGVLLVLLVPCTDWFITFSQLGGGNVPRAIAVTPINLLLQLILLPVYLWLMLDQSVALALDLTDLWPALMVVLVPLALSALSEHWIEGRAGRARWRKRLAWYPVPLLAVVVFLIAGAQADAVRSALSELLVVIPLFLMYLLVVPGIAKLLAWLMRLPTDNARTLAFSMGTRNSFVVLPFALVLPTGWDAAAMVIVLQSVIELFGMVIYLWWIPRKLFNQD